MKVKCKSEKTVSARPPRTCSICRHPEAEAINAELSQGYSQYAVAIAYGVAQTTLWRHCREHLLIGEGAEGMTYVSLTDLMDIPLQVRERGELIKELITL